MDITFNESFAASLANTLDTPVFGLPAEFQFGQLTKLAHPDDPIWQLKQRYDPLSTVTVASLQQAQTQLLAALKKGEPLRFGPWPRRMTRLGFATYATCFNTSPVNSPALTSQSTSL